MNDRQRRTVFAVIFIASLVVVAYLVFFTPSESTIDTPTPTAVVDPAPDTSTPTPGA
jgi:hypothetical protein